MGPDFVAGTDLDAGVVKQSEQDKKQSDHRDPNEFPNLRARKPEGHGKGRKNRHSTHKRNRFLVDFSGIGLVEDVEFEGEKFY